MLRKYYDDLYTLTKMIDQVNEIRTINDDVKKVIVETIEAAMSIVEYHIDLDRQEYQRRRNGKGTN